MSGFFNKLNKLRGRSLDELYVRSAQALSIHTEKYGLSKHARIPTDQSFFKLINSTQTLTPENLLENFQSISSRRFFPSFSNKNETINILRQRFEHNIDSTIEYADKLMKSKFDLLAYKNLEFGDPIDWHFEPISNKRTGLQHWSQIDYLNREIIGDKKIVWELNRHQYLTSLGKAYWYTNDERYAETFVKHISLWMKANPPKLGINWASNLEVAFRAISWIWALNFFKDSQALTPNIFLHILKFLYLHARHLEKYLSTYFSPNTHLTGEALGLFYIGTLFQEFKEASRWQQTGLQILIKELNKHVQPDGVYFEQTTYYHRYTTDFYLHLLILTQINNIHLNNDIQNKLLSLLDHLMYITRPDGTTPLFGDDDGGRLLAIEESRIPNDFRLALSTGSVLFNRSDYKFVSGGLAEETIWMLGFQGAHQFDQLNSEPPINQSKDFNYGGYYVMRDGWSTDSNYLMIDCGPHGTLNCGHAHADVLSFDLSAYGRTLLVDPGTYTYTGSAEMRNYFRSSQAHNTLVIDSQSSSEPGTAFTWKHIAQSNLLNWITNKSFDFFEGTHNGYEKLSSPATHTRSILFLKKNYWIVFDRVITSGQHSYDIYFHFNTGTHPVLNDQQTAAVRERQTDLPGLEIFSEMFSSDGIWKLEEGSVSNCYGGKSIAPVARFTKSGSGDQEFITFLFPRKAHQPYMQVEKLSSNKAFKIIDADTVDILIIGNTLDIETEQIKTNFKWTWLRRSSNDNQLQELILLEGNHFYLNGQMVFSSDEAISYIRAARENNDWVIESDKKNNLHIGDIKSIERQQLCVG
jgi:hypothetical protein